MGNCRNAISWSLLLLLMGNNLYSQAKGKQNREQQVIAGRINSPDHYQKPYVVLISADGFRYDYMERFQAKHLQQLSAGGVRAKSMVPAFPSLTFPNHYTLVTGLYPAHHGLVDNTFFDPALQRKYSTGNPKELQDSIWYGGEPLWVLAEKQQMLSATYYWVGSDVAVQGIRPSYFYHYGKEIGMPDRLAAVKDWLALPDEKRPHFITFYFPEVDHEAHEHGPDSPETAAAVQLVDQAIGQLQAIINESKLPVNIIFVSDHGMSAVDTVNTVSPPAIDTSKFLATVADMTIHIYSKNKSRSDIESLYQQLKAGETGFETYLTSSTPRRWRYDTANDRYSRIGDILLLPKFPHVFSWGQRRVIPGRHGYDPYRYKEMHASFYAWGPQIRSGKTIGSFESVHVYSLIAELLGLEIPTGTDSRKILHRKILR